MQREREISEPTQRVSKRRRSRPPALPSSQQEEPLPLTPGPTIASTEQHIDSCPQRPQKPPSGVQSERKPSALSEADHDRSIAMRRRQSSLASEPQPTKPHGSRVIRNWLRSTSQLKGLQEAGEDDDISTVDSAEDGNIIPSVEEPSEWETGTDESSQESESTQGQGSTVSDELVSSSPSYRATLKMNGVVVDNWGTVIPREVQDVVTKHIRKERKSPKLGEEEKARILRNIEVVWNGPDPRVWKIVSPPIFPSDCDLAPSLAQGGGDLWSTKPLPRNPDYPLITPETDLHLGYQTTLKSKWTRQELIAADHYKVRPYSQPTDENMFPSFLIEVRSEATGGTLYAAEARLATAGFHRVRALLWVLDQINPNRSRSSSDAIVFSAAVSQRQAVAYVHYYNPDDKTVYMSFIDSFYYAKDIQGCQDFNENVKDWLLEVQQPIVRDAMKALYPITQLWEKSRSCSARAVTADDAESSSFGSDGGRPLKIQKV